MCIPRKQDPNTGQYESMTNSYHYKQTNETTHEHVEHKKSVATQKEYHLLVSDQFFVQRPCFIAIYLTIPFKLR